jgi:hypothetical protein
MSIDKKELAFTLSHSSLELLNKCLWSWYQRYVEKWYPDVEKNPASEFGSLLHISIENYTGTGKGEMNALIEKYRDDYELNEEYSAKIPKAVDRFLEFYEKHLKGVVKMYKEKTITILLNQFLALTGSLDVLYQTVNGNWIIVDWKTTKKMNGDVSKQLSCYFYLLSAVSKTSPKQIKCQVVYLAAGYDDEYVQEYTIDEQDKEIYENLLLEAVDKISRFDIETSEQWKRKPSPLCPWCSYYLEGVCSGTDNKVEQE